MSLTSCVSFFLLCIVLALVCAGPALPGWVVPTALAGAAVVVLCHGIEASVMHAEVRRLRDRLELAHRTQQNQRN